MKRQLLDNLSDDAKVISSDGKEVGKLHAVVVDPRDDEVTHVVVNAGPHFPSPGFGAPKLVSVPMDQMEGAEEGKVFLSCSEQDFNAIGPYVERDFVPHPQPDGEEEVEEPDGRPRPVRALWNAAAALAASFANQLVGIPVPRETFKVAQFERQIVYDSPIWRIEPHEQLGEVERILVGHESDEIEALVVRSGHAFNEDTVLPVDYIEEILDGVVRVQISDDQMQSLQRFEAEPG
jgi:sporulation protein YlmC with PRC-barrel domain